MYHRLQQRIHLRAPPNTSCNATATNTLLHAPYQTSASTLETRTQIWRTHVCLHTLCGRPTAMITFTLIVKVRTSDTMSFDSSHMSSKRAIPTSNCYHKVFAPCSNIDLKYTPFQVVNYSTILASNSASVKDLFENGRHPRNAGRFHSTDQGLCIPLHFEPVQKRYKLYHAFQYLLRTSLHHPCFL